MTCVLIANRIAITRVVGMVLTVRSVLKHVISYENDVNVCLSVCLSVCRVLVYSHSRVMPERFTTGLSKYAPYDTFRLATLNFAAQIFDLLDFTPNACKRKLIPC